MIDGNYFNLENLIREKESNGVNGFMNNHNFTEKELMSENGYIASAVILFLIGVFGFFLNFAVIFILTKERSLFLEGVKSITTVTVFMVVEIVYALPRLLTDYCPDYRNPTSDDTCLPKIKSKYATQLHLFVHFSYSLFSLTLRTPFNMILLNLTCADFSVSILGNPITFSAAVYRKWIFGRTVCVLYGFFMALAGISSITTITVLSYDRYLNIAKPFHTRGFTIDNSKLVILGIWIYSFILTFPPLVGWGEYVNESADISCSVNWEQHNVKATTYIIYLFVFGLVIPVCIILFSYTKIILTVIQKKIPCGRVSKVEVRVAVMTAVIVTVFLLSWTPYAVLALIVAFGDSNVVTPAVSVIPALIAKSSICYNPIIYAGLNTQIRKAGLKLWQLHKATDNTSTRDDANSRLNRNVPQLDEMPTEAFNITACAEIVSKCGRKKELKDGEGNNEQTAA